jgi:drug/metabolite transporter (DMT)-like permease
MEGSYKANWNWTGFFYLFIGIFTWATVELTVKLIQANVSATTINFYRVFFGGIVLIIYTFATKQTASFVYFAKNYPKAYLPATFFGLAFGLLLFFYGVTLTQANISATIFSANPIVISAIMMGFKGEKRTWNKILGILIGFIGVIIIVTEFNLRALISPENILGNILVLIGMFMWCIHVIIGKVLLSQAPKTDKDGNPTPPLTSMIYNSVTFLWGVLMMIPFLFFTGDWENLFSHSPLTWIGLIYLGAVTGGLGYVAFFRGLQMMDASKGITMFYLKPVIATILAFFLLNEIPKISLYIGIGIEILALFLVAWEPKNK